MEIRRFEWRNIFFILTMQMPVPLCNGPISSQSCVDRFPALKWLMKSSPQIPYLTSQHCIISHIMCKILQGSIIWAQFPWILFLKCADGVCSVRQIYICSQARHNDMQQGNSREMAPSVPQLTYHNIAESRETGTQTPCLLFDTWESWDPERLTHLLITQRDS